MTNVEIEKETSNALDALFLMTEIFKEKKRFAKTKNFDDFFPLYETCIKQEPAPTESIDSSYNGLHLGDKYEESDFLKLVDYFNNGNMIHIKYAIKIVEDSIEKFKNYSNIVHCDSSKMPAKLGFIVVGDLHGSFKDLCYIINNFGIPGKNYRFIFNGDFVDRGLQQCEVLLTILYAHLLYPTRVFINRGNHEEIWISSNKRYIPNFKTDTEIKFKQYGAVFFNRSQELFRHLLLGTVIENSVGYKVFITHGGISKKVNFDDIALNKLKRADFDMIEIRNKFKDLKKVNDPIADLLWSDPIQSDDQLSKALGTRFNNRRGLGCYFDEKLSEKFCLKYGFNSMVRSHEPRKNGFSQDQPYCFTIFSASNYRNLKNDAAVLCLEDQSKNFVFHVFNVLESNQKIKNEYSKNILITLKSYLVKNSILLSQYFRDVDNQNKGYLDIEIWALILANFIQNRLAPIDYKHLIALKNYLCECDFKFAYYPSMFWVRSN